MEGKNLIANNDINGDNGNGIPIWAGINDASVFNPAKLTRRMIKRECAVDTVILCNVELLSETHTAKVNTLVSDDSCLWQTGGTTGEHQGHSRGGGDALNDFGVWKRKEMSLR